MSMSTSQIVAVIIASSWVFGAIGFLLGVWYEIAAERRMRTRFKAIEEKGQRKFAALEDKQNP
jgi:hypothetical protein